MANLFYEQLEEQSSGKDKIELEILKNRLESINSELKYFWEDHLYEKDPHKILVLWGRLQYMMGEKMNIEMEIERAEKELNQ